MFDWMKAWFELKTYAKPVDVEPISAKLLIEAAERARNIGVRSDGLLWDPKGLATKQDSSEE